ncbi:MAG: ATP phosphoribosyltransferase regulatory subunit [Fusobacteriaceae bacterium]|jgi:ATP phosphoribosyltransferase regulatory subunit|nr:ATP phosphoribosyltransferase regulatory subunit [Fusobacteriaceae bacterium]
MNNYRKMLPEGVRDYCDSDMMKKDFIATTLKNLYIRYGYSLLETPTWEYVDVFNDNCIQNPNLYTLTNRNGEILALRSDMTKSVSRVLSNMDCKRLCYVTNIYRYPRQYAGKLHEFTQAGIELTDTDTVKADVEAIRLAILSLREIGLEKFSIHIGSSDFLKSILNISGNTELALEAIRNSDGVTLENCLKGNVPGDTLDMILELTSRVGKYELLEKITRKFPEDPSLKRLSEIYDNVRDYDNYINFDFSLLSYWDYYSGVTFQAFVKGVGRAVISGGRYTEDINHKTISSVGFGMEINPLIGKIDLKNGKKHILIAYGGNAGVAWEKADRLVKEGKIVTVSGADTMEEARAEAEKLHCDEFLFFGE